MGVQKRVGKNLATGVVGNFATSNPYHNLVAGVMQHRVGAGGAVVGQFAEIDPSTGLTVQPLTGKNPIGCVGRESNLAYDSTMNLTVGQGINLYDGGDFFAVATGFNVGDAVKVDTTGAINSSGTIATTFKVAVANDESGLSIITRA